MERRQDSLWPEETQAAKEKGELCREWCVEDGAERSGEKKPAVAAENSCGITAPALGAACAWRDSVTEGWRIAVWRAVPELSERPGLIDSHAIGVRPSGAACLLACLLASSTILQGRIVFFFSFRLLCMSC